MSSKFLKTSHNVAIDSLIKGFTKKLDNQYYVFTDKKPTPVTYYNLHTTKSTVDEGTENVYSPLGNDSPFKFNKIENALLFGIERMVLELNMGDYGPEASEIEGEAVVLPNTFIPYPDDYFSIKYLDKEILFRVTEITPDTLENGANFYRIRYKLDQYDKDIEKQVEDSFKMVVNNVGTEYKSIISSNDYEFIEQMELVLNRLKTYYTNLFFKDKVQTFVYSHDDHYFYDPYMIEFLIRNDLLNGGDSFIYVGHQLYNGNSFAIDYDRTFFRNVELKTKKINLPTAYGMMIQDPSSLLSTRYEDYYTITYRGNILMFPVPTVPMELVNGIIENIKYEEDQAKIYNIIIDYFNEKQFDSKSIEILENLDYQPNIILFYMMPIIIYILEDTIKSLLVKTNTN